MEVNMGYQIKECKQLGEKVYEYIHPSGLKLIFAPKPGYFEKYASFSVNYGSIDCKFKDLSGEIVTVPAGIAHFLEHKLFEQEDGSVMDKFASLGSNPNAFTSFTQTSYLFSCTDSFDENFKLLMNFVQNPYLTKESVEKEKSIIGQEINMYRDNPSWVTMMNFLNTLYFSNPIRNDIAGTIDSISKIDTELLYKCYNNYYRPSNMVISVAGDLDYNKVIQLVNDNISSKWVNMSAGVAQTIIDDEPALVKEKNVRAKMDVFTPMFMFGFKGDLTGVSPIDIARHQIAMKILLEILFGRSSSFYEQLYNDGLINDSFYCGFESLRDFGFISFEGESNKPEAVVEAVLKHVSDVQKTGIDPTDFNRVLNNFRGSYIKRYNSVESICRQNTGNSFAGLDIYDYFDLYATIKINDVQSILEGSFDEGKLSLTVTEPYN